MEPMIGEIRMFGGNFAPRSWAFCDGQLQSISQNQALFSILGTNFGGDGRTTFGLPDLRGRVPIQQGTGPGLPQVNLGQSGGTPTNTLTTNNLASHNHVASLTGSITIPVSGEEASSTDPTGNYPALTEEDYYAENSSPGATSGNIVTGEMRPVVQPIGAHQPVNNMAPTIAVRYIICLIGIFPSRN